VCSYGSVEVTSLRTLEVHPTVLQTTATVKGKLHPYQDRLDLLRACFPGGSITGCPKIRSMQIIDELEPCRRSIYTGSLGYLSFHGDMDLNIIIRTLWKVGSEFYLQVGAGIVADSDPGGEYEETLVKGRALAEALCPGASYVTTQ
jgi:para-aminobenzoate synthetase component 1